MIGIELFYPSNKSHNNKQKYEETIFLKQSCIVGKAKKIFAKNIFKNTKNFWIFLFFRNF